MTGDPRAEEKGGVSKKKGGRGAKPTYQCRKQMAADGRGTEIKKLEWREGGQCARKDGRTFAWTDLGYISDMKRNYRCGKKKPLLSRGGRPPVRLCDDNALFKKRDLQSTQERRGGTKA